MSHLDTFAKEATELEPHRDDDPYDTPGCLMCVAVKLERTMYIKCKPPLIPLTDFVPVHSDPLSGKPGESTSLFLWHCPIPER